MEKPKFNSVAYRNQWQRENCDRVQFMVKKGQKARLAEIAEARGMSSITEYLVSLIEADTHEFFRK